MAQMKKTVKITKWGRFLFWWQQWNWKRGAYYKQGGVPLFSHWSCIQCGCWLMREDYAKATEDYGCPRCGASLWEFQWVKVDAQQTYNKIMGYGE